MSDRIRLLVVADVSLSVRSITGFALRLAQTLHAMAFRCRVLAYVDDLVGRHGRAHVVVARDAAELAGRVGELGHALS
ncbi:hypothetical protein [Pseudonocardia asaccharolytica]|uniref:Uncharacterized protein n=1 Tax=Pseudonocardia asaccharolytica DSM 44247 = NBRC 16224 TaxID=1123024 RepID=A0A511D4X3_9PSEU|nr:hypothetical protein [Pseudonocardia asaccharolytica]GEL19821.1 hypothetical protein PA7_36580 [Pseudonocardia asaccharolytica DSM 44247 = NBRC 16224]